jgi:aspartate aminotransferase-like enzyme
MTLLEPSADASPPVGFLPGPVMVSRSVQNAFHQSPVSHRTETFLSEFHGHTARLCRLAKARNVALLMGSGTLANEAVASQLSLLGGRGLVLAHGEFGNRLIDQARRWSLSFETMEKPWGSVFYAREIEEFFQRKPEITWLWAVHCETSTGVLQNLDELRRLCHARNVRLCLDSISSLGTVPVDLSGVYLASGVSGKGLGAYPGLCMVFSDHSPVSAARLPQYLDLGFYSTREGIPFTFSSNLLAALGKALDHFLSEEVFSNKERWSRMIRRHLTDWDCRLIAPEEHASPAVISFAPPPGMNARVIGRRLARAGYRLSYQSTYLRERGWLQICLMGEISEREVHRMLACMGTLLAVRPKETIDG